jgi:DNA-binding SARP family transcriptional activator
MLLGGFLLMSHGSHVVLPQTAQRVLAFLALHDRPLLRTFIAGSLWPDVPENQAAGSLRSALWRLGQTGIPLVASTTGSLQLGPSVTTDLRDVSSRARDLLEGVLDAESHIEVGELSIDVLPDWSEDWVLMNRERFRQLRLHALEALCDRYSMIGKFAHAIEAGLAAVEAEPLCESAHRVLIAAHIRQGNPGEALAQYRTLEHILNEELGLEPSFGIEEVLGEKFTLTAG